VTLVDAAQSAGHRPIDAQQIGSDFLVFSGHKMCGPTGVGVLYARQEILESMQPYQGGGEMIISVEYQQSTWKHGPHKFEAGTPNMAGAIGLHAAMDYLEAVGRETIRETRSSARRLRRIRNSPNSPAYACLARHQIGPAS